MRKSVADLIVSIRTDVFKFALYGGLTLIALVATAPLLCLLLGVVCSYFFGCQMGEDSVHDCVVLGINLGGLIYYGSIAGFILPFSLIGGIFVGSIWFVLMMLINWMFRLKVKL